MTRECVVDASWMRRGCDGVAMDGRSVWVLHRRALVWAR